MSQRKRFMDCILYILPNVFFDLISNRSGRMDGLWMSACNP